MPDEESGYLAYMLRIWETKDRDASVWRTSLENPHTGARLSFATLEDLFAFLTKKVKENSVHPIHPPDKGE